MAKRIRHLEPRTDLERWFQNSDHHRTQAEWIERCTSTHPNHEALGRPIHGKRQFWQVWCSICKIKGWNISGPENPEMSIDHITQYDEQWKETT